MNNISGTTRPPTGRGRRNRISEDISAKDISRILRMIRPSLRSRGGNVELVGIDDSKVVVRLSGACAECPLSFSETAGVVERIVRSRMPQISELSVI